MVNKRTKVLMSAYACEPNKGSEPGVGWNWAVHMAKTHEVYVITRSNNKDGIEEYLKHNPIEHLHFYYHDCSAFKRKLKKMPNGIFIYYKMWQKEILPLASTIVEEEKIDLVHHVTFNEFRTPGKLYKLSCPFVWGPIGGGQFYNPIFKNAYFSKKDLLKEKLRNTINRCYLRFSSDIHCAVRDAAAILIADQSTEAIMPQTRKYIRLLETGYNLDRNGMKNYDISCCYSRLNRPINLLWIGGIWPRKGLKILLDALHESNFHDYRLKIVGKGEDKANCEKLVKQYGLEDKITFLGALSYEDVNGLYDDADVFIFTSLRDTSGNVVLEAMSHGLPVISIDHHGVGEMVTDFTGIKIPPVSYEQVKKNMILAIKKYYETPELMKIHGEAGRKRIEESYSWEHNASEMLKVYDQILKGKNEND